MQSNNPISGSPSLAGYPVDLGSADGERRTEPPRLRRSSPTPAAPTASSAAILLQVGADPSEERLADPQRARARLFLDRPPSLKAPEASGGSRASLVGQHVVVVLDDIRVLRRVDQRVVLIGGLLAVVAPAEPAEGSPEVHLRPLPGASQREQPSAVHRRPVSRAHGWRDRRTDLAEVGPGPSMRRRALTGSRGAVRRPPRRRSLNGIPTDVLGTSPSSDVDEDRHGRR
jgi:hypothetical protein